MTTSTSRMGKGKAGWSLLQNTPSAQMLESTSQSSPGILILGGLEFLAVPPFCPIQATLQTARLESMSSMGGREPCLILGLALQALYQTPSCAPWNPFRRAGCQPSISGMCVVWGEEELPTSQFLCKAM